MFALLILIYIAFISLGLPDSLLGSSWPAISRELSVSVSYAGIVSMIVSGGTIVSSLLSDRLIHRLGTGKVTLVSVFMTAVALLGFSAAPNFWILCLLAVPLGLGAGSVDAALNNFVALHYKAKHMSWLHCFWGIGATTGPVIMSLFIAGESGWKSGYRTIGIIQVCLVAVLLCSLSLWKQAEGKEDEDEAASSSGKGLKTVLGLKGAKPALLAFFAYCAVEATAGLWGSSFLVLEKGIGVSTAAGWISLFYLGITVGRFLSGFITIKLNNKQMIRLGQGVLASGVFFLLLGSNHFFLQAGFVMVGLGCAPIYPCMLHDTPNRFGKGISQAVMGVQMACAYVGTTFMPPFFGLIAQYIDIAWFPVYLAGILLLMIITCEIVNKTLKDSPTA